MHFCLNETESSEPIGAICPSMSCGAAMSSGRFLLANVVELVHSEYRHEIESPEPFRAICPPMSSGAAMSSGRVLLPNVVE